jgi:hypothetical protein
MTSDSSPHKRGLGGKHSLIILLIASFIAYLGYCALRDALQMRRDNEAFVSDSARVIGRIVSHETYTDTTAQRNSHYKPVVAYTVNGMSMQVTAQNSTNLRGSLTEFKVGTPIEVIYLRQRPQKARVAGFEFDSWFGMALFGFLLLTLPTAAMIWGIWRRWLFFPASETG